MNLEDEYAKCSNQLCDAISLGWGTKEAQETRFHQIFRIGMSPSDSVLDVGCGYGDLRKYLIDRGITGRYVGIDKRRTAIDEALKRYSAEFICADVFSMEEKFDWVVASGIFCMPSHEWHEYTKSTIDKMRILSGKGISVNFLSDLSPHSRNTERKYVKLSEVERILEEMKIYRFSILHDYRDNDLTLHIPR